MTAVVPPLSSEPINALIEATIQPDELLYVGLHIPDQTGTFNSLGMEVTASAETHSGYMCSRDCSNGVVSNIAATGASAHLIITVTGTRAP